MEMTRRLMVAGLLAEGVKLLTRRARPDVANPDELYRWISWAAEGVNTGVAYGAFARASEAPSRTVPAYAYSPDAFTDWAHVCALAANDFEQVVPSLHAGVAAVLPVLRAEAQRMKGAGTPAIGMMSGSGATCFLLHDAGTVTEVVVPEGGRIVRTATA